MLFGRNGFAGTSIEEVIATCGIGRDTYYRRFESKLALFEAVALRERERTNARFTAFAAASQGSLLAQLEAAAWWLLDANLDPTLIAMKRIAFSEARVFGRATQEETSPIVDHLKMLVSHLQSEGTFRCDEDAASTVGFIINALVLGPMMQAMLAEDPTHDEEWKRAYFNRTWSMIVSGLMTRDG
jgi:TetR/AcrR family transcriptional regulator of autoinduction and epiphytic fitness